MMRNALILRWLLVPICCAISALYSMDALYASISIALSTVLYNECGIHGGHWLIRNVIIALDYASFELGATLVASKSALF